MSDEYKKKKTQTITFRLLSSLIEDLKKDAEFEKINLNSLITKILSNHIQWERFERKVGLLPMTKPFVKDAINRMTLDEIINLAEKIEKQTVSDIVVMMKNNPTIKDVIDILRSWLNVAWMQHLVERTEKSYNFKIQHDLGEKWSLYVKTMITELFNDVLGKRVDVKITKNTISFILPIE